VLSSERFRNAFYNNIITDIYARPFVVLIAEPTDDLSGLADAYNYITLDYFSIPEALKFCPALSKFDALGLCTVSGGIPKIMRQYDTLRSFEENLRNMFNPQSAFINFMPELMSRYFRKPEGYQYVLYAIASGSHSVSKIGKFTGLAYNKCDNYLSGLVSYGIIRTEKIISKRGAEKTAYRLANNYFRLWYLYVYRNRTEIQLGNEEIIGNIVRSIVDSEIHEFHLQKAFLLANKRIHSLDLWTSFRISETVIYSPQTIGDGGFSYNFDAIVKNGGKAIFVKIFADPLENLKKDELEKIRTAVTLANRYYDSHILIFSKRRFSDYAVAEAAKDDTLSLVEVDRLKF
jgi:hypothetical protein